MTDLLNTTDYSTLELTLALVGSVLWVLSYLLLVKDSIKHKFVEIPFFAVCGNFAWEFLYAFIFVDYINLGKIYVWGYQAWFFIDVIILFFLFKYGKKQARSEFLKKNFNWIVPGLLIFYGFFLFFWIKMGFDNTPFNAPHTLGTNMSMVILGASSAFVLNLIISVLYLRLFLLKNETEHFSFWNGVCRWIGTALFTVLFHLVDPENYLITILGIVIFVSDFIYVSLVYKKNSKKSLALNKSIPFTPNTTFHDIWLEKQKVLSINGVDIKYVRLDKWSYKSDTFECFYTFYEGNMVLQDVKGKMSNEDAEIVVPMINQVLKDMNAHETNFYFISNSRNVKMAEPKARKISMDFFDDNEFLSEFIVIVSPIVSAMIKLAPIKSLVDSFVITNSKEEAFNCYCKSVLGKDKSLDKSRYNHTRLNDSYNIQTKNIDYLLSAMSLNQFHKVDEFYQEKKDGFNDIYGALKVLANDKKLLIQEINHSKIDFETKFSAQQTHFNSLFHSSGLYSIILDENFNLLDYNEATFDIFNQLGGKLIRGYNISNFVTPRQMTVFEQKKLELEQKDKIDFVHNQHFKDGSVEWYETTFFKLKKNEQLTIGIVSTNITTRITLEKEKVKLVESLRSKNDYLQSFHHTISHNLNHEIANIEQIVSHLNNPIIDVRKKMELIEDLTEVSDKLKMVKNEMNESLRGVDTDLPNLTHIDKQLPSKQVKNITLIDDDPITNSVNRLTIKHFCKETNVTSYKSSTKALNELSTTNFVPDIVFLDINMPEMNGWEFLAEFNDLAVKLGISIYILSSSESKSEKKMADQFSSVKNFITKPLSEEKLSEICK